MMCWRRNQNSLVMNLIQSLNLSDLLLSQHHRIKTAYRRCHLSHILSQQIHQPSLHQVLDGARIDLEKSASESCFSTDPAHIPMIIQKTFTCVQSAICHLMSFSNQIMGQIGALIIKSYIFGKKYQPRTCFGGKMCVLSVDRYVSRCILCSYIHCMQSM